MPLILRRVFTFPPFLSLIAAFIWGFVGQSADSIAFRTLERIASTLVPLALFAVGSQLQLSPTLWRRRWQPLVLGLGFKLILAPVFFIVLYGLILGQRGFIAQVTMLEAAMAPMITAAVVAVDNELDAEMANLMVGLGIPLSLLSVPCWHYLLAGL